MADTVISFLIKRDDIAVSSVPENEGQATDMMPDN